MSKQPSPSASPDSTVDASSSDCEASPVRIDRWLWSTRVYKTRSDAADACRGSAVRLNGMIAKPSAKVRIGDTIVARTKALTRTLHVVGLTDKRVGASLLPDYFEDKTPEQAFEMAREKRENARRFSYRGSGRPSKKDRREIEKLSAQEADF